MNKYWCIYRITNKINGKTYIGQHKTTSVLIEDGYMGSGTALQNAKRKIGEAAKNRTVSEETRRKLSDAKKGKHRKLDENGKWKWY